LEDIKSIPSGRPSTPIKLKEFPAEVPASPARSGTNETQSGNYELTGTTNPPAVDASTAAAGAALAVADHTPARKTSSSSGESDKHVVSGDRKVLATELPEEEVKEDSSINEKDVRNARAFSFFDTDSEDEAPYDAQPAAQTIPESLLLRAHSIPLSDEEDSGRMGLHGQRASQDFELDPEEDQVAAAPPAPAPVPAPAAVPVPAIAPAPILTAAQTKEAAAAPMPVPRKAPSSLPPIVGHVPQAAAAAGKVTSLTSADLSGGDDSPRASTGWARRFDDALGGEFSSSGDSDLDDDFDDQHLQQLVQAAVHDTRTTRPVAATTATSGRATKAVRHRTFSFLEDISEEGAEVDEDEDNNEFSQYSEPDRVRQAAAPTARATTPPAVEDTRAAEISAIAEEVVRMRRTFSFFDSEDELDMSNGD
jgi:hypothetical protein